MGCILDRFRWQVSFGTGGRFHGNTHAFIEEVIAIIELIQNPRRILFYVEEDYSFAILRPLQISAKRRGYEVRWLPLSNASVNLLEPDEIALADINAAVEYNPDVVVAPGDRVPGFIPGIKVQVFHGLNEDKRAREYVERGLFDLFCTEGPARTATLESLADQRGYFRVRETGWLKLDAILKNPVAATSYARPQILFASTFTPRLSAAEDLFAEIKRLSRLDKWQWLVTLHPKMAAETVRKYRSLEGDNLSYHDTSDVIGLLHRADLMVSDNSSILQEFLLLKKPVVTYRNRDPQACLIDITRPVDLEDGIYRALKADHKLLDAIMAYGSSVTPYLDGASSDRILNAIEEMIEDGWKDTKPANVWRNFRMRQKLDYK